MECVISARKARQPSSTPEVEPSISMRNVLAIATLRSRVQYRGKSFDSDDGRLIVRRFGEQDIQTDLTMGSRRELQAYRGVLVETGEQVAIKPLNLASSSSDLANFEIWLRQCGFLNHENVIELLGTAVLNDIPVVISKFCPEGNIVQYLERNPRADRRNLLQQVADGLNYVLTMPSRNPIIHSNLKPSNILVDNGTIRLGDVGLLGWLEDHNAEGDVQGKIGDLRWMAPEVLEGQSRQWWSDVYSFGCLALYILRDEIPYASLKTDTAVSKAIYRGDLPLDRGRMSTIHPTWKLCWSHDPQRRPTMATILDSLAEW